MITMKELEVFAKEAAKGIKTPQDLNDFSQMLKKSPSKQDSKRKWMDI